MMKNFCVCISLLFGISLILCVESVNFSNGLSGMLVARHEIEKITAGAKGICQDTTNNCAGASPNPCDPSKVGLYSGGCTGGKHITCQGTGEQSCNESYNQYCCETNTVCVELWIPTPTDENPSLGFYSYVVASSSLPALKYNTRILCNNP